MKRDPRAPDSLPISRTHECTLRLGIAGIPDSSGQERISASKCGPRPSLLANFSLRNVFQFPSLTDITTCILPQSVSTLVINPTAGAAVPKAILCNETIPTWVHSIAYRMRLRRNLSYIKMPSTSVPTNTIRVSQGSQVCALCMHRRTYVTTTQKTW